MSERAIEVVSDVEFIVEELLELFNDAEAAGEAHIQLNSSVGSRFHGRVKNAAAALAAAQRVAGLELPEGKYVMFTESGAGHPCRIVIQFQDLADMQRAHERLVRALALSPGKEPDLGWLQGENETIRERRTNDADETDTTPEEQG